jgi:hypothetical protein
MTRLEKGFFAISLLFFIAGWIGLHRTMKQDAPKIKRLQKRMRK